MNYILVDNNNTVYKPGDYIKFKIFLSDCSETYKYIISKGKIINVTNMGLLEVKILNDIKTLWVNSEHIVEYYPKSIIPDLSLRLIFKRLWKNLIFREVKTVKTKYPFLITYQYINNFKFVRSKNFDNINDALYTVPLNYQSNIIIRYYDYYGFTTDKIIRNNDPYYNKEIFFSRKCYRELNLNGEEITGGFLSRRGLNMIPPRKKQYICGLVGKGYQGLFYRKWFICSKEFITLWTMICDPTHFSLKNSDLSLKSFPELINDLDTSHYNITNNNKLSLKEMKTKYQIHNIENTAIYFSDLYQKIAKAVYCPDDNDDRDKYMYPTYEEKLTKDLLWMK